MLEAFAALLVFQLIGETLSYALGLPIPGPVIGMVLLLAALALRRDLMPRMRPTATTLLSHLSLLFVPAGVGVMVHFARLSDEGVAIVTAVIGSTLLAIVATAGTLHFLMRRPAAHEVGAPHDPTP